MNKHTPGPWRVQLLPVNIRIRGPLQEYIVDPCCGVRSKADACLIAAAPDLLEALKALVKANEEWNAAVESTIGRPPTWTDGYLDSARDAIAKAEEGESRDRD